MSKPKIGFIGLGTMGMGMASQLHNKGFDVTGYDIQERARDAFKAVGGKVATTPAAAAENADVLHLMVFNSEQAEHVLFDTKDGATKTLRKNSVVVLSSTVAPSFMRALGKRLAALDILFIDGPVSGGAPAARDGTLTMMASGSAEAFKCADPALQSITSSLYRVSEEPGVGSSVKAVNQLLAGVHVAVAAEGMALGTRAGADPRVLYEIIRNSAGSSILFDRKVPQMLDGSYSPPLSTVEIWIKDLAAVLDTGKTLTLPLPLTAAAHQLYLSAAASGHSKDDYASVVTVYEKVASISVTTPDRNAS